MIMPIVVAMGVLVRNEADEFTTLSLNMQGLPQRSEILEGTATSSPGCTAWTCLITTTRACSSTSAETDASGGSLHAMMLDMKRTFISR